MSYICLDKITFGYEEGCEIFKDFSLEINRGECVVIRGDNGSGKSTLFRILNGLSFPSKGAYTLDGVTITKKYLDDNRNSKLFHKKVGFLFQNPDVMLFNSNVFDEIAFGPRQMGLSDEEVNKRVDDCMQLLEIKNIAARAPYNLSGGQKKKVAMAAVLSLNPKIIVLDEPLSGLDKNSYACFLNIIMDLKKAGKTLVIATHDDEFSKVVADRQVLLFYR